MKKFETGKKYTTRSICDSDCVFEYEIVKRTEKTVTIKDHPNTRNCGIKIIDNQEIIYPEGKYSMCPVLRA